MRRADRLFQIVQYLRGGRLITAAQIADKLEVTTRTIYRDIADLIGSGVPIEGEAGVGYVMRQGYDIPPLMFTKSEIIALVTGARMVQAWGGAAMAEAAVEALIKIEAVLPKALDVGTDNIPVNAMHMGELDDSQRVLIDTLEDASRSKNRVSFDYRDKVGCASNRTVRPLCIWYWGKVWTLVSWCELRDDFRMFRIDRMGTVKKGVTFRDEKGKTLHDFHAQSEQ